MTTNNDQPEAGTPVPLSWDWDDVRCAAPGCYTGGRGGLMICGKCAAVICEVHADDHELTCWGRRVTNP